MRRLLAPFVAVLTVVCLLAGPALAAAAPATTSNLTFGDPFVTSDPKALPFQTNLLTPDVTNTPEGTTPICLAPSSAGPLAGQLVPAASLELLRLVVREGELILANDNETIADKYDGNAEQAYKDFINYVRQGKWQDANKVRSGSEFDLNRDSDDDSTLAPDPFVNAMLNPTATGSNTVRANIPAGCIFDQQIDNSKDDLGSLFRDPGSFVWNLLVWIGTAPAASTYNWLAPITYQYSFFTPHAERGETLFDLVGTNNPQVQQYGYDPSLKTDAVRATTSSPWLVMAVWMRAMLSGFYVLALIVAGFMFMLGANARRKVNALRMIPRVLLSVVLTLAIPTLIGMAITISNLFTQEMFSTDPTCVERAVGTGRCQVINQVNAVVQQSNQDLSGISNYFDAGVFQIISVNGAAFFYAFFAAVAILRQLAMIALIVVAPAACFVIILENRQRWFFYWMKAVIAVCLIPVLMALILRVGLSLNPLATKLASASGTSSGTATFPIGERFLSLMIMFCTFYFMMKIPRMLKGWVTGHQGAGFGVQALRGLGGRLTGAGHPALIGAGRGMVGAAGAADMANQQIGRLVPGDSNEHRALPTGSLRAKALRRVSGTGTTPGGIVEAAIAGAPKASDIVGMLPSRTGGDPATGAGPGSERVTLTQQQYQAAVAKQGQLAREARDAGLPVRPMEWTPQRDNEGNYWSERNPNYESQMITWRDQVRAAAAGGNQQAAEVLIEGAEAPLPNVGGAPPKLEVPVDLGSVSAPPGSLTGTAAQATEAAGQPGVAVPLTGKGPAIDGALPGADPLSGAPGSMTTSAGGSLGPAEAGAFTGDADSVVGSPLSSGERPVIEPVSLEEQASLFEPLDGERPSEPIEVEVDVTLDDAQAPAPAQSARVEAIAAATVGAGSVLAGRRGSLAPDASDAADQPTGASNLTTPLGRDSQRRAGAGSFDDQEALGTFEADADSAERADAEDEGLGAYVDDQGEEERPGAEDEAWQARVAAQRRERVGTPPQAER